MSLKGPNSEDVRKLHAEINQIVNQRFLLVTLAITIFGAMATWMLPKQPPSGNGEQIGGFTFAASTLLSLVLLLLFYFNYRLAGMLRTLTTYLFITGASHWEADWRSFREKPFTAYTDTFTTMFMVLTCLSAILPFLLCWVYPFRLEPIYGAYACAATGAIVVAILYVVGHRRAFGNEARVLARWQELMDHPTPPNA